MTDLLTVLSKPCKTPSDTRARLIELERKIRIAEDITGQQMNDAHIKSILATVLDEKTRAHTTHLAGARYTYADLNRGVLIFVGNNLLSGASKPQSSDAMDLGQFQEPEDGENWEDIEGQEEQLSALQGAWSGHRGKGRAATPKAATARDRRAATRGPPTSRRAAPRARRAARCTGPAGRAEEHISPQTARKAPARASTSASRAARA